VLIGSQHGGEQCAALDILECYASQQKNAIVRPGCSGRAEHGIFNFGQKRIGRVLRVRAALTASAASRSEYRSPRIQEDYREDG
jgi:hypothetical protein